MVSGVPKAFQTKFWVKVQREWSRINFTDHFFIEPRSTGQFLVVSQKSLALPNYPSSINETLLYTTILCNGQAHPLITMRMKASNTHSPHFYNPQPYELTVFKGSKVDRLFATPILALDKDPAATYPIKYVIEGNSIEFSLAMAEKMSVQETLKALSDTDEYSRKVAD
uniref:Vitellogenin n=1 Tax=Ditylenchus dipsaci TaxID=166011 RepID=A0A915E4A6_9BILA